MLDHFRGHAMSGIRHAQTHVRAGREVDQLRRRRLVVSRVGGLDQERAAIGHCIARVHHEIQEELLELPRVGADHPEIRRQAKLDGDALRDAPTEHLLKGGNQVVQLQIGDLHGSLVREGQKLPREHRAAFRRAADLDEIVSELGVVGKLLFDKGRVVQDDGEKIVEVMRDAARQKADTFQALRLPQARLEVSFACFGCDHFGDVSRECRDALDRSVGVAERGISECHVEAHAILAHPLGCEFLDRLAGADPPEQLRALSLEVWWHDDEISADGLVRRVAVDPLRGGVPVGDDPIHRRSDDRVRRRLHDRREARPRGRAEAAFLSRQPPHVLVELAVLDRDADLIGEQREELHVVPAEERPLAALQPEDTEDSAANDDRRADNRFDAKTAVPLGRARKVARGVLAQYDVHVPTPTKSARSRSCM